jgi:hypothetical protein
LAGVLQRLLSLVNKGDVQSLTVAREEECNKYDFTGAPYFLLAIMIGPGGLLLVVSHLFAVSILVLFTGGVGKIINNNNNNNN